MSYFPTIVTTEYEVRERLYKNGMSHPVGYPFKSRWLAEYEAYMQAWDENRQGAMGPQRNFPRPVRKPHPLFMIWMTVKDSEYFVASVHHRTHP